MVTAAVIFDFDGTLADTREAAFRIYNRLAPDYGARAIRLEEIAELRHLGLRDLLKKLEVRQRHVPSLLRKGKAMLREYLPELQPCAGVFEELPAIRARVRHCGILTSNSVENVELFLEKHGAREHFDFVSSCRRLKGKAKYLRAIARTYSLDPAEMLYVGDEVRDVRASRKAGVPVAVVGWGFNSVQALRESGPNWLLQEARELARLVPPLDGVP
jgi:HAD superfamily hydrolase (TIGR01549 family)